LLKDVWGAACFGKGIREALINVMPAQAGMTKSSFFRVSLSRRLLRCVANAGLGMQIYWLCHTLRHRGSTNVDPATVAVRADAG